MKKYFELTYQQLLIYGIHLGHTFANSLMYAAWMVFSYKENLLIMNIYKTFYVMKVGFRFLNLAVYYRSPIWFINLDKSAGWYSKSAAYSCGESSWIVKWANGVLVNYMRFHETYKWLMQTSTEWAYKAKNRWVSHQYDDWCLTRNSWPRVVLVSSVYHSKAPVKEALYLGIPCIGIVDTNVNSNKVTVAVPGNDESLECLVFYSDVVANYILIKKFNMLNKWYLTRCPKRALTFKNWLFSKYNKYIDNLDTYKKKVAEKTNLHIALIHPYLNLEKNLWCSVNAIFGRNTRFNTPLYSYLDLRECDYGTSSMPVINKLEIASLALTFCNFSWWWGFLGAVNTLKRVFKSGSIFRKKMRIKFRSNTKTIGRRRRRRRFGRIRWIVTCTFVALLWNIIIINLSF